MTPLFRQTLFLALRRAGAILHRNIDKPNKISFKNKSPINLVTWVDKAADKLIIATIRKQFPDHEFLTEESYPTGSKSPLTPPFTKGGSGGSSCKWIIDPLDGTTNFAHHFPQACVSIGLEHDGKIILGGVLDPFREELFWAEKGKGAYLISKGRSRRIRVSSTPRLREALLLTGFPYDRRRRADFYLSFVRAFLREIQGIRRAGAAALDLCWVACGRVDGYWEWRLKPWDSAAGSLIVEEAGGSMSDFSGGCFSMYGEQTLASNGKIHRDMLRIMRRGVRPNSE